MAFSMQALQQHLQKNVVEAKFMRRHPKTGYLDVRGAFITTNFPLLNNALGLGTLRFQRPKGVGMSYDHTEYNLVVAWDIFRQEYRVFAVENSTVINSHDVSTEPARVIFWQFMKDYVLSLTPDQKLTYMGYVGK